MNSMQLEYFLAVARCGGFTAAARKLYVSQPALSKQLRLLEEELGVRLLVRRPRGVSLTPEGRKLLVRAGEVSRIIRDIPAELAESCGEVAGELDIACSQYLSHHFMPDLLKLLLRRYPGIRPRIRETSSELQETVLRDGRADIGIGTFLRPGTLPRHPIFHSDIVLVRSVRSDLAGKKRVTKKEIAERHLVCHPQGTDMYDAVCRILSPHRPRIFMESCSSVTIIELVRQDFGLALVPEYLIEPDRRDGIIVGGFDSGERLTVCYHCDPDRPLTPQARAFVGVIREKFALDES